jgi:hypothetical protein
MPDFPEFKPAAPVWGNHRAAAGAGLAARQRRFDLYIGRKRRPL